MMVPSHAGPPLIASLAMHATGLAIAALLSTPRVASHAREVVPIELVTRDVPPAMPPPQIVKPRRDIVKRAPTETVTAPKPVSRPEALDVPALPSPTTPESEPVAPLLSEPPPAAVAPSTVDAPTGHAVAGAARGDATVPGEGGGGGVKTDSVPHRDVSVAPGSGAPGRRGEGASASGTAPGVAGVALDGGRGLTSVARPTGGYQTRPRYPETARRAGVEGVSVLRFVVLADGRVGDVLVERSAGREDLDRAAITAVSTWRFEPARRGSEAVPVWVTLPVRFELRGR